MQIKNFLLIGALLLCNLLNITAQTTGSIINGNVADSEGNPIPGALIKIPGSNLSTTTNTDGFYSFKNVPPGKVIVQVSSIGMKTHAKEVNLKTSGQTHTVNFNLYLNIQEMETVAVLGRTETQEANRQAYNVTAIDAKKLHNLSQDINQVIGKVSGVRIREDGGLGSNFNFSLNGFSGRQVKFFIDGVPMDNFGSALSLNNLPINLAERIEIYKGVVPVSLGSDALGGAINIITNGSYRNYLDISYSYGSFNTHRTAISSSYRNKKNGFTFLTNAFHNHSDNNYWVKIGITDLDSKVLSEPRRVRRFHDDYSSKSIQLEGGISDKKYADQLLFGLVLADNYKEIQTAAQMSRVYGGWHQKSNTIMPTFKYRKNNLFTEGLSFSAYGSYNFGKTQNIDTLYRFYNWAGEFSDYSINSSGKYIPGGENSRSLYKFRNNSAIVRSGLDYKINERQSIALNYVFTNFDRQGSDVLKPNEESYTQPQILRKSNIGLGYKYDIWDKFSISLFAKQYLQQAESSQRVDIYNNPRWEKTKGNISSTGYGAASTYFVLPALQLKASYEKTYRLPEGDEMFGDGINHTANKNLKPESSHNINFGFNWNKSINKFNKITAEANLIYRNASDFIRIDLVDTRTQSVNIRGVKNIGFDNQIRYALNNWFNTGFSMTYQHLINTTKYETPNSSVESPIYLDQIPNIPYLYGNFDVAFRIKTSEKKQDYLNVAYFLNYVNSYYLKWPSLGYSWEKNEIPTQLSHDISFTYTTRNNKYNISLDCRNLLDEELFDNFLMQKPGRSFNLKLRYYITNYKL